MLARVGALGPGPFVTLGVPDERIDYWEGSGDGLVSEESVACEVTAIDCGDNF